MPTKQYLGTAGAPFMGTSGDDLLEGSNAADWLFGAGGNDLIYGYDGDDVLNAGGIFINGSWQPDTDGDKLFGGAGNDKLYGNAGNDTLSGGLGVDLLYGLEGDDTLYGSGGDTMYGGDGDDSLFIPQLLINGATVNDTVGALLDGGAGNDELEGADGYDELYGGSGNDLLVANGGDDHLEGGAGDDDLQGGLGDDYLDGGTGSDILQGGAGNDYYVVRDRNTRIIDTEGKSSGIIMANWIKPANGVSWTWGQSVQKLPYWIDALSHDTAGAIADELGAKHTVYYAFAQQPASWFTATDRKQFSPFNSAQKELTIQVLKYIGSVVNINFVQTTNTEQSHTIVFGNNEQENSGGYAGRLDEEHGSPVLLDYARVLQDPTSDNGDALAEMLLHEIGHALHLKHPFGHADANGNVGAGPFLPNSEETELYTVMSYTDCDARDFKVYSPFDLAALQYVYGIAPTARSGNNTYVLDPKAMNMLWDGNGIDTVDGTALEQKLVLDLRPGYWSYIGSKAATISADGQITINFGTVLERAFGGKGHDTLIGNEAANTLSGGAGDDTLQGLLGNDFLSGGSGLDTAVFSGKRSDYTVTRGASETTLLSVEEGFDRLSGVERLAFADTSVALDVDGINGQLFRLYQAAYDRKPDKVGLGFWVAMADRGVQLNDVASAFTGSAEFAKLYGAKPDDAAFLGKLYNNVLHRQYDQGGFDFWLGVLKGGYSREFVLIEFAESKENVANVAALIANGFEYTPYI
ncbi:DUF4214 domain-containing protein [Pseudoduganella sp. OTU4001]|uniref:DUF4214 domain-containing protein n=1 Tax=Pseudoduganella sp. OTU4001 TaxID=3043854 RepID=UPI00313D099A